MTVRAPADPLPVEAAPPLRGTVRVPGSKSLTNRALVLAALADGRSEVAGALLSEDTESLSAALTAMGATIATSEVAPWRVDGVAGRPRGGVAVHCADGGTPARFLLAVAAIADGRVTIDGSARLRERPMADGATLLAELGATVTWRGAAGCLPVEIQGHSPLEGGAISVARTASSQFVSALLLVGPLFTHGIELAFSEPPVSASYIELTVAELVRWGVQVTVTRTGTGELAAIRVPPGRLAGRRAPVEADASSAVFWAAAAAAVPGSSVLLGGLSIDSPQPDMGAIRALAAMGALVAGEEGGVRVTHAGLRGIDVDCSLFPDGALAVIAIAALASSASRFNGLATLRVKECDRVHALVHNLRLLGVRCEEGSDWIAVHPRAADAVARPGASPGASVLIPTFRDHRVAMAFAVLGLRLGNVLIENPACVGKSYPGFWRDLDQLRLQSRA